MALNMLRRGAHVRMGPARFLILKRLDGTIWQLENTVTGEWSRFAEEDLLDRFARHELMFEAALRAANPTTALPTSTEACPAIRPNCSRSCKAASSI